MAGPTHHLAGLAVVCALCAWAGWAHPAAADERPPSAAAPVSPQPPAAAPKPKPAHRKPEPNPAPQPKAPEDLKPATRLICPASAETVRKVQRSAAAALKAPVRMTNSIGMKLVLVPAGEFMMGSPGNEAGRDPDEGPQHRVEIPSAFYLGECEVTEAQYQKLMGGTPPGGHGPKYPATRVSWKDAQEFCRKLSLKEGKAYRLPTEAEWEYACRAGGTTRFWWGDDVKDASKYGNVYQGRSAAKSADGDSPAEASGDKLLPVGQFAPNALGVRGMLGNVWDWCQSLKKAYPYRAGDGREDLAAAGDRVLRGGSWASYTDCCRSASRHSYDPTVRFKHIGFRVVLPVD